MKARFEAIGARASVPGTGLPLLAALTACLLALCAFSANAGAADFTWSSSVSTTQAGGHPNVTLNFASPGAASLSSLDIDLPEGMMHRGGLSNVCSNPLYKADSCPASSTVGTVTSQIAVGRLTLPTKGTIYQTSNSAAGDLQFGIILRPPLSTLGLTGKIFLSDTVHFRQSGGLTHSIAGPMGSITVGGTTLASHFTQLQLQFTAQQAGVTGALLSNPTSCRVQHFTATGTFSDGTTRDRTSSFTTTGCPSVPFAPTTGIELDNNAANQRTSFAILLGGGGSGGSALHASHIQGVSADLSKIGSLDLAALDATPACTDAQMSSASGCPDASRIGDISAEIEGFGAREGALFRRTGQGHPVVATLVLTGYVTPSRFMGSFSSSSLSFTDLPQLPLVSMRVKVKFPWLTEGSSCDQRSAHFAVDSFSGGHIGGDPQVPPADCSVPMPVITVGPLDGAFVDSGHQDFGFTSPDTASTFECSKDGGAFAACKSHFVDDWQGEGAHSFSVRALARGRVSAAATRKFTVDTMPPTVATIDPADADLDGDGYADQPFRGPDFSVDFAIADAGVGVDPTKSSCTFTNAATGKSKGTVKFFNDAKGFGRCAVSGADSGDGLMTVNAVDRLGHAMVLTRRWVVDTSPPIVTIDEPALDYRSSLAGEFHFTIEDDSLDSVKGFVEAECTFSGASGDVTTKAKVITDRDSGRSKGFGICAYSDLPEGAYKVTVRGWDPVKKEAIAGSALVIDTTAPSIAIDEPGVHFTSSGDFDVFALLTVTEANPWSAQCSTGDLDGDGSPDYAPCGPGQPVALKKGLNAVNVKLADRAGNVGGTDVLIVLDQNDPTIVSQHNPAFQDNSNEGTMPDYRFSVDDDSLDNGGVLDVTCTRKGLNAVNVKQAKLTKADAGRALDGVCSFDAAPDGAYDVTLVATDQAGNSGADTARWIVDSTGPVITFVDPGDVDADGDGYADNRYRSAANFVPIVFDAEDSLSDVEMSSAECVAKTKNKGVIKGNINIMQANRASCGFTGLPDGDTDIELSIRNHPIGTVTIVKLTVTIDGTPPSIAIDEPGVHVFDTPDFSVAFTLADDGSGIDPSSVRCRLEDSTGQPVAAGDAKLQGGLSHGTCDITGAPQGDSVLVITAKDQVGNRYVNSFEVELSPDIT